MKIIQVEDIEIEFEKQHPEVSCKWCTYVKVRNKTDLHKKIIVNLYRLFIENKLNIPPEWIDETYRKSKVEKKQMIIDYISGMTDRYILNIYNGIIKK